MGRWLTLWVMLFGGWGVPSTVWADGAPVVERIEPRAGPAGSRVRVFGRNLRGVERVTVGGVDADIERALPSRLDVRVPEGSEGGALMLRGPGGATRGPEFRVIGASAAPVVARIEPEAGPAGSEVTIEGAHFSPRLTRNLVTLNEHPVVVRSATPRALKVIVPEGASDGTFRVRVLQAGEATSQQRFEVTSAIRIDGIQPPRGSPGTQVRIRGAGFSARPSDNRVYLSGRRLEVLSASAQELVVKVPDDASSGGTLRVDVRGAGSARAPRKLALQRAPVIAGFWPEKATAGKLVTVHGSRFGSEPTEVEAKLGEAALIVREATDSRLVVEIPGGASTGHLSVKVRGSKPTQSSAALEVVPAVKLTSFSPASGPAGTEVTLEGSGFAPEPRANVVKLGGRRLQVLSATPTALRVRVGPGESGRLTVRRAGTAPVSTSRPFVVTRPPQIESVRPLEVRPGGEVAVKGAHFGDDPRVLRATLDGQPLEIVSVRDDQLVVRLPPDARSGALRVAVALEGTAVFDRALRVRTADGAAKDAPGN